jgi:hypothetical protein
LTTTTTTRRDARSTRTPRPAVAPDRVSLTPTPPARSIETRSIGRHHRRPRRHHRPLATTTRRRTDRRSTTKTSRLFFSSRLRHRLRLRTVASSVAPLRPTSASPTSDNALEVRGPTSDRSRARRRSPGRAPIAVHRIARFLFESSATHHRFSERVFE